METETIFGHPAIVRHFFSPDEITLGSKWISSLGNIVKIELIEGQTIYYSWTENGELKKHNKDSFSFQCRYSLIID
jgi:hypothetical protein